MPCRRRTLKTKLQPTDPAKVEHSGGSSLNPFISRLKRQEPEAQSLTARRQTKPAASAAQEGRTLAQTVGCSSRCCYRQCYFNVSRNCDSNYDWWYVHMWFFFPLFFLKHFWTLEQSLISHDAKTVGWFKNGRPPAANLFSNTVQAEPLSAYGAFFSSGSFSFSTESWQGEGAALISVFPPRRNGLSVSLVS